MPVALGEEVCETHCNSRKTLLSSHVGMPRSFCGVVVSWCTARERLRTLPPPDNSCCVPPSLISQQGEGPEVELAKYLSLERQ